MSWLIEEGPEPDFLMSQVVVFAIKSQLPGSKTKSCEESVVRVLPSKALKLGDAAVI